MISRESISKFFNRYKNVEFFKNEIKRLSKILLIVVIAFLIGTFTPNEWAVKTLTRQIEDQIGSQLRYLGFRQPEFTYNDEDSFIEATRKCVDYLNLLTDPHHRIPSAIIIGMAVIESAYGESRFAREGNALFGVKTWDPAVPQIKPSGSPRARWGIKKYVHKCESVSDMINIINTHPAYEKFRKERNRQYDAGRLDYRKLLDGLMAWSTNPRYTEIVMNRIKKHNLP